MRKSEIKEIENKAERVLREARITKGPVPLEIILERHQITLLEAPSDDYSGMMLRTGNEVFIGLSSAEHPKRKRFTLAHELGHFFLENTEERAFIDETETIDTGERLEVAFRGKKHNKGDYEEMRANAFAASLLMPARWLIKDLKSLKKDQMFSDKTIEALANKYEVSEIAMRYRVMNVLGDYLVSQ